MNRLGQTAQGEFIRDGERSLTHDIGCAFHEGMYPQDLQRRHKGPTQSPHRSKTVSSRLRFIG